MNFGKNLQHNFSKMRGGGQRPFGTFPKIHPFWKGSASLTLETFSEQNHIDHIWSIYLGERSPWSVLGRCWVLGRGHSWQYWWTQGELFCWLRCSLIFFFFFWGGVILGNAPSLKVLLMVAIGLSNTWCWWLWIWQHPFPQGDGDSWGARLQMLSHPLGSRWVPCCNSRPGGFWTIWTPFLVKDENISNA